jgi:phage gp36-like protein
MSFEQRLRYIKLEEFINEIPENMQGLITDDNPNTSVSDSKILAQKGVAAEAEFDSYIISRYPSFVKGVSAGTITVIPEQVRQTIYTILKYHLYARRNALTDSVTQQYQNVITWLKNVAMGKANIPQLDENNHVKDTGVGQIRTSGKSKSQFGVIV